MSLTDIGHHYGELGPESGHCRKPDVWREQGRGTLSQEAESLSTDTSQAPTEPQSIRPYPAGRCRKMKLFSIAV